MAVFLLATVLFVRPPVEAEMGADEPVADEVDANDLANSYFIDDYGRERYCLEPLGPAVDIGWTDESLAAHATRCYEK